MKTIIDTVLFLVSKIREIYSFFFAKKNEKLEIEQKTELKKDEATVKKDIKELNIKDLNDQLGWKD